MALGRVSENSRQSRKDTNSIHMRKFVCESTSIWQQSALTLDTGSCDSGSLLCSASRLHCCCLLPSSLLHSPHSRICANHCSSKVHNIITQLFLNERSQIQHMYTSVFVFLCLCLILLQYVTHGVSAYPCSPIPATLTGSREQL